MVKVRDYSVEERAQIIVLRKSGKYFKNYLKMVFYLVSFV